MHPVLSRLKAPGESHRPVGNAEKNYAFEGMIFPAAYSFLGQMKEGTLS